MKAVKIRSTILSFSLVTVLLMVIASCEKTEVGPKGDRGDRGDKGTMLSRTLTIAPADWSVDTSLTHDRKWRAYIESPEISAEIISKGSVQVYWQRSDKWVVLPFYDTINTTFSSNIITSSFEEGNLNLVVSSHYGTQPPKPATQNIRVIVLSGTN